MEAHAKGRRALLGVFQTSNKLVFNLSNASDWQAAQSEREPEKEKKKKRKEKKK